MDNCASGPPTCGAWKEAGFPLGDWVPAGDAFRRLQQDRDVMKNIEITATRKAELVGQLYIEKEIINSLQLNFLLNTQLKITLMLKPLVFTENIILLI